MSGVVKSVGSALGLNKKATPQYETYNTDTAVKTGNIGVSGDLGNIGLRKNSDGTWSRTISLSGGDQQRNNLMADILGGMGDTSGADQFYRDASTRINKEFADQRAAADENLINRGIAVGNEQYNDVMGDITDRQNQNLNELATQAIFKGEDLDTAKVNRANALSAGRDVGLLAGLGLQNDNYSDYMTQSNAQKSAKAAGYKERGNSLLGFLGF